MVIVSLVDPRLLPDSSESILWCVKCCDHRENILVNPYLDLKVYFTIDPMDSVELAAKYVLDILWWPLYY